MAKDTFIEQVPAPRLDAEGREILDSAPMAIPAGFKRPDSIADQVRRLVRSHELAKAAEAAGLETFEESEDFEVDETFDPHTPYELQWDPVLGRDVAPADFNDPVKKDYFRKAYLVAEENALRAEARQDSIEELYRRYKEALRNPTGGAGGAPPAPSPKAPEGPSEAS